MSLRALQRSAAGQAPPPSSTGAGGGRGKGRGRSGGQKISLQEFHQQQSSNESRQPSRPSAWGTPPGKAAGRGGPIDSGVSPCAGGGGSNSKSNAWCRGPPTSAVDSLWDAAPAAPSAVVSDGAWEEPPAVEEADCQDWGGDADAGAGGPAVHDAWQLGATVGDTIDWGNDIGGDTRGADVPRAVSSTAVPIDEDDEEEDITPDIVAWLRELNLLDYREAVLAWCEDMGAASLEEVVESVEELVEAVSLKPLQARRLQNRAAEAMSKVRAKQQPAGEGLDTAASRIDDEDKPEHTPQQPRSYSNTTQSFYGSATADVRAASTELLAACEEEDARYLKPGHLPTVAYSGDGNIRERPATRATFTPTVKVSQNAHKRQQRKTAAEGNAPSRGGGPTQADAAAEAEEEEARRRRDEAAQLLQQQLEEEENRKANEARERIESANSESDADKMRKAIAEAEDILPANEISQWRDSLLLMIRRRRQRCENAVCSLQALLEAPRDSSFGEDATRALKQDEADARQAEGGARVVEAVKAALREWEVADQRREEASMALHFAMRRFDVKALQVALDEAREAGLNERDSLFAEASRAMVEVREKESADKAASERLRLAMDSKDIEMLELAVEECVSRELQLHGADTILHNLRVEADLKAEASQKIRAAVEAEDVAQIRAAIREARATPGLEAHVLEDAEARARDLEVAAKRRRNANVELHLACSSNDARRLEAAVAEARRCGVDPDAIQAAQDALAEARRAEERRAAALKALEEAVFHREAGALRATLEVAEYTLGQHASEVEAARAVLREVEEQLQRESEAEARMQAEAALRAAAARGDWKGIEEGRRQLRGLGALDDGEVLRFADEALEELREAREVAEARQLVENTEATLKELARREAQLSGPAHKKERAAIGKEIMALKADAEYISAVRFLRNPTEERQRREQRKQELEQRRLEASGELSEALQRRDEAAVTALLAEDSVLNFDDVERAKTFLAEQERLKESAARDASILEFSYAGLDRRSFFQASIAMNELFTESYCMQEGTDFKLKVVKASNSVLVAFRSVAFAEAVQKTAVRVASELGERHTATVVVQAEVRGALDFSYEAHESLPSLRQDAESLQLKPARTESEQAVAEVCRGGAAATARRFSGTAPPVAARSVSASQAAAPDRSVHVSRATRTSTVPVAPSYQTSAVGGGIAKASVWAAPDGAGNESSTNASRTSSVAWPALPQAAGGGGGSSSSTSSPGISMYPGKAGGRGQSGGVSSAPHQGAGSDVLPLPREAAAWLQRDRNKASTFRNDLRVFAGKFRVSAELEGLDAVVMKPMGFVHQEALRQARVELEGLLDYHFPDRKAPASTMKRRAFLRVDPQSGAGIEMTPLEDGYRVDHVEAFPGQDFQAGEVIVEINGRSLVGLSEEDLEDTFAECFADGAALTLCIADAES